MAQNDYQTNTKGEIEVRYIMEHLDHQDTVMLEIIKRLEAQHEVMLERLTRLDPEMAKQLVTDSVKTSDEIAESGNDTASNS